MSEIKERCPFCGGECRAYTNKSPLCCWIWECTNKIQCGISKAGFPTEQAAIDFANQRHRPGVTGWVKEEGLSLAALIARDGFVCVHHGATKGNIHSKQIRITKVEETL